MKAYFLKTLNRAARAWLARFGNVGRHTTSSEGIVWTSLKL
jgi:hypothetical protein